MKKLLSFLLAFALAAGSLLGLPAAKAEEGYTSAGFGHYGKRFWIGESPIEPQAKIYRMVLDALEDDPFTSRVELRWEATPLHFTSYLRDEALLALRLDHPELDLEGYTIETWDSRIVTNYVAELSLTLKRDAPRIPDFQKNLQEAAQFVAAAPSDYGKAHAAFSWLLQNCSAGGSSQVEQLFGKKQGTASAFSAAFKLLLDGAGLESVMGYSSTFQRAWNYVKLEDKWYVVDFNSALPLKTGSDFSYSYQYFLTGDDGYTQRESFPAYMKFLGRLSQLSPTPESVPCRPAGQTYTVTLAEPANGRLEARLLSGGAVNSGDAVPAGASLEVTLVPDAGYDKQVRPLPASAYLPSSGGVFTWVLANIQQDLVLDGYFSNIQPDRRGTFTFVNPSSGGTISARDAWNQRVFQHNYPTEYFNVSEMHLQFIPAAGYHLERILFKTWARDDGEDPTVKTLSGSQLPADGELVVPGTEITPYSYVTAEFAQDSQPRSVRVSWNTENGILYAAEAATGNAVENGGSLPQGADLSLTLLPDAGYRLESLTRNAVPISQRPDSSGKLLLPGLEQDTVLSAVFVPDESPQPPAPPSPPSGGGDPAPEPPSEPQVTVQPDGSAEIVLAEEGISQTVRVPVSHWDSETAAVLVYPDGTEKLLKKAVAKDGSLALSLDRSARVEFRKTALSFADAENHWGRENIAFASARKLFEGTGGNRFSPDASMTRAMLATVLYRLEDSPSVSPGGFPDLAPGAFYGEAAAWASETGIVLGSGGKFLPGQNVTREELAAMLFRYAAAFGFDHSSRASLDSFSDGGSASPWAKEALSWAVSAGLLHGREHNTLAPRGTATRAEVAAVLQRLLEKGAA